MTWPPEAAAGRHRKPHELEGLGDGTRAVHAGEYRDLATGAVGTPIFQASTFYYPHLPTAEGAWRREPSPYIYTRYANPTVEAAEVKLAALEKAEASVAFSSGMAAIAAAVTEFAGAGERLVAQRDLYGVTHTLFAKELPKQGVRCDFIDPSDLEAARRALRGARALYLETPTNPLLRVVDVPALAELAHEAGATVLVDSTFGTPLNQNPLAWGADVVLHSATKYLNGHSDVIAGFAAGSTETMERLRRRRITFGGSCDPHQAWLLQRGMKTLALRVAKANENGLRVAQALARHDRIGQVWYPGLETHPTHALARRLMRGFGGVVAATVKGGDAAAEAFMQRLRLFAVASSLGGTESLVSMPVQTSHLALSPPERAAVGIEPGLVRLALGIEDAEDLVRDLERALG